MQFNGRVNLLENNVPNLFQINNNNNQSNYDEALRGNIESSLLSKTFFSKQNIQIIQNAIREGVYKQSNNQYIIAEQDDINLKIIMRALYLQYSRNNQSNITKQVENLNNIVSGHCIPKIISEAKAYNQYRIDASTLVTPIDKPIQTTYKYKSNEFKRFF